LFGRETEGIESTELGYFTGHGLGLNPFRLFPQQGGKIHLPLLGEGALCYCCFVLKLSRIFCRTDGKLSNTILFSNLITVNPSFPRNALLFSSYSSTAGLLWTSPSSSTINFSFAQ